MKAPLIALAAMASLVSTTAAEAQARQLVPMIETDDPSIACEIHGEVALRGSLEIAANAISEMTRYAHALGAYSCAIKGFPEFIITNDFEENVHTISGARVLAGEQSLLDKARQMVRHSDPKQTMPAPAAPALGGRSA